MKEFSELTLQKLCLNGDYYVYGLIDPRNNRLFYIGKGTGNRVFQHVAESGKHPESEKEKLRMISEIEQAGHSIKHILINWGLNESEAFAAEASLINLMHYLSPAALSNIVAGHHSTGCASTEEIERQFGAELLTEQDIKHKLLIIKVNKLYDRHMSDQDIYDIVRGIWRADIHKARQADYVLGVYNNLIIGCYKPEHWYRVCDVSQDKLPLHTRDRSLSGMENRIFFECSDTDDAEGELSYLYKSIERIDHIQKSQNPITYIGI